jgi:2'-5' RNA ligase
MCDLVEAIETLLAGQGFPKESKKYTPHLTIGRVRESGPGQTELGRRISENAGFDAGTSRIEEVLVVASRLDPKGAEYTVLGRAPLGH